MGIYFLEVIAASVLDEQPYNVNKEEKQQRQMKLGRLLAKHLCQNCLVVTVGF